MEDAAVIGELCYLVRVMDEAWLAWARRRQGQQDADASGRDRRP